MVAVRTTCPRTVASGHQACWPYTRAPRMVLEVCNEHKRAEPGHFSSNQFCQTVDTAHGTPSRSSAFAVDGTDQQMRLPRMLLGACAERTHRSIQVVCDRQVDDQTEVPTCKTTAMETLRQQHHVHRTLTCECSTLAWPIPQGRRLAYSASTRQSLQIKYSTPSCDHGWSWLSSLPGAFKRSCLFVRHTLVPKWPQEVRMIMHPSPSSH